MLLSNRVSRAVFGVVDLGKEEKTKSWSLIGTTIVKTLKNHLSASVPL